MIEQDRKLLTCFTPLNMVQMAVQILSQSLPLCMKKLFIQKRKVSSILLRYKCLMRPQHSSVGYYHEKCFHVARRRWTCGQLFSFGDKVTTVENVYDDLENHIATRVSIGSVVQNSFIEDKLLSYSRAVGDVFRNRDYRDRKY